MASYPQDLPFGIMDVVELTHIKIRRPGPNSVYVDCPFCGDRRGKMNVNYVKNVWRCNYCDEHGGMLSLYAKMYNTTNSDAFREICDALQTGDAAWGYRDEGLQRHGSGDKDFPKTRAVLSKDRGLIEEIPQSPRASIQDIHQTLSLMLKTLPLTSTHRAHLRSPKRGLTDEQIDQMGFKSTPPPFLCRSITDRLIKQGCAVQGVPGFYLDDSGRWTVKFTSRTSGILIPAVGMDGLIHGAQILLDTPIKGKDDPPDKVGTKYIWFSSSSRNLGVTSGSPVHFVGNPFARTIYVTEGLLKADIAHCLMNRSFIATAGAGNVSQIEPLFAMLAANGTELIVESDDMDKFSNKMTAAGTSKIYLMARKCGMNCKRLTWNPNYKGIDDWQLALRQKEKSLVKEPEGTFKQHYLSGLCEMKDLPYYVEIWQKAQGNTQEHTQVRTASLPEHLGLTEQEYQVWQEDASGSALKELLLGQRRFRRFRVYQVDFREKNVTIPYAFRGIADLHKAGYEQPPAADYRLVHDGGVCCPKEWPETEVLEQIYSSYRELPPDDFAGRPLSPSDVVELYDEESRSYFYRDKNGFVPVRFSPFFAKPFIHKDVAETQEKRNSDNNY